MCMYIHIFIQERMGTQRPPLNLATVAHVDFDIEDSFTFCLQVGDSLEFLIIDAQIARDIRKSIHEFRRQLHTLILKVMKVAHFDLRMKDLHKVCP